MYVADVDYLSQVPPVQFNTFDQRQFVQIRIFDDQIVEGDELFVVSLESSPISGVMLSSDPAHVTILENDCEHEYVIITCILYINFLFIFLNRIVD